MNGKHPPRSIYLARGKRSMARVRSSRAGMTLVELALSLVVVTVVLGTLVLISSSLRADNSNAQTRQILSSLNHALHDYHKTHGEWPPSPTHEALKAITQDADLNADMKKLGLQHDSTGRLFIRDGYGQIVRYVATSPGNPTQPDFVSAGPDRSFGDLGPTTASQDRDAVDNLYGVELENHTP